jgi:hypothetical protein
MYNTARISCPFWISHHLREVKTNSKEIYNFYMEIRLAHTFIGEKMHFLKNECLGNRRVIYTLKPMPYFPPDLGEMGTCVFGFSLYFFFILFLQTQ